MYGLGRVVRYGASASSVAFFRSEDSQRGCDSRREGQAVPLLEYSDTFCGGDDILSMEIVEGFGETDISTAPQVEVNRCLKFEESGEEARRLSGGTLSSMSRTLMCSSRACLTECIAFGCHESRIAAFIEHYRVRRLRCQLRHRSFPDPSHRSHLEDAFEQDV